MGPAVLQNCKIPTVHKLASSAAESGEGAELGVALV